MELLTSPSTAADTCNDFTQNTTKLPQQRQLLSEASEAGSPGSAICIASSAKSSDIHCNLEQQKAVNGVENPPQEGTVVGVDNPTEDHQGVTQVSQLDKLEKSASSSTEHSPLQHEQQYSGGGLFLPHLCPWLPLPRDDPYVGFLRHSPLSQQLWDGDNDCENKRSSIADGVAEKTMGKGAKKQIGNQSHNAAEMWAEHLIRRTKKAKEAKKKKGQNSENAEPAEEPDLKKGYNLTGLIDILWEVPIDPDFAVTRVAFSRHQQWERRHLTKCMLGRIPIISFGEHYLGLKPKSDVEPESRCDDASATSTEDDEGTSDDSEEGVLVPQLKDSLSDDWHKISKMSVECSSSEERTLNDEERVCPNDSPIPFPHQTSCSICRSDFQRGEKLRVLPCKHLFHQQCIDQWLLGSRSAPEMHTNCCPLCKADVSCEDRSDSDRAKTPGLNRGVADEDDVFGNCPVTGIPVRCFMNVGYEQWMNATRETRSTDSRNCDRDDTSDKVICPQQDLARPLATSQKVTVVTLRMGGPRSDRMRRQLWNLSGGPPRIRLLSAAYRTVSR